jgi:hypothetical protein
MKPVNGWILGCCFLSKVCLTIVYNRDGRGMGFDPRDPRGHVATGGRGKFFSIFFGAGEVRVSLAYGRSGTGEAMNKKMRSSGGRG